MKPSLRKKRIFPSNLGDRLSVSFAVCELFVEGFFELLVILPRLYPEATTSYWLSVAFGLFLFVNTLGNMFMSMATDLSSGISILPSVLKPSWSYCPICMKNSPPRSFHCYQCNACILKRDHHCLFIGNCVGHANQRYYLMSVMYISFGALYANYLNMDLALESVATNLNFKTLIASFTPIFGWLLGLTESTSFFIAFQSGTCVLASIAFTILFIFHLRITLRGQTTHELRRIRDRSYDLGVVDNLREALGTRWYLVWIFPAISSPLPSDGLHFRKRDSTLLENVKDM
ncbi:probable palmitoyltransferase ZDHHC24 [Asterias amurensis]|uniref:probable palmitoyltransferase ZDHHC24 n=1 Tax=Asterias amurensis TaxID=7602 RepID=UPI003AB90808